MKLILLFTTFPVRSETFLQREVRALRETDLALELWSLWGGESEFEGTPIRRVSRWALVGLLWWMPYWAVRAPRRFSALVGGLFRLRWRNPTNYGENLLGVGLGLVCARSIEKAKLGETSLHAVWASLPAAFGWAVAQLTELPFSFAGHAYDLFENGGDGLMAPKLATTRGVRTSTRAGRDRFMELGMPADRIAVIRRGLDHLPEVASMRHPRRPVRLVAVGRFVPKMGFGLLADVFDALDVRGVTFEARIIGDGPEWASFEQRRSAAPWSAQVDLRGVQPFENVEEALRWGDLVLFTGRVAESGDRAGFPNIIGEAMAHGRPVLATPVGAVTEVLEDGETGRVLDTPEAFAEAIAALSDDDRSYQHIASNARAWVESEFDARSNMQVFSRWIDEILA